MYLGGIVDLAYGLLAVQVAAATEQAYGLTAITVVTYAFFGSLGLYTAAVILHNFDSKSILDFRGVFLAIHQYQ